MAEYLIIIEKAHGNYAAYLGDLPGYVATRAIRVGTCGGLSAH